MRILVQPERLRQAAQELCRAQEAWQGQAARLRQVFSGLDWETRQQLTVETQVQRAVSLAESLAARAGEKASFLEAAAARFEQADAQAAQTLGAVLGTATAASMGWINLPSRLNDLLGNRLPVTRLVPLAAGSMVAGLGVFASLPWLGSALSHLVEQIWAWLRGRPEKLLSPVAEGSTLLVSKGQLAKVIRSGLEKAQWEQEQKPATLAGQVVQSITIPPLSISLEEARKKLAGDPSMTNMWRQVDAPIQSTSSSRHPDLYKAVIEQFDVEHSHLGRYRPSEQYPDTRCNIFAGDVMRAMAAPLPTKGELYNKVDPMTANARDIHAALRRGWGEWRQIDINNPNDRKLLLEHLRQGKPAVAADPGHIAVLRPDQPSIDHPADLRVAQAGASNANNLSLGEAGYGSVFQPDFFIHD